MGITSKSLLILLIAITAPLIYRQYASEDTIKFMSTYYSNYKVIDRFLRESASQLDRAKDYLPDKKQVENLVGQVQTHIIVFISTSKNKLNEIKNSIQNSQMPAQANKQEDPESRSKYRMTNCPGEESQVRLWTKEELAKFDGSSGDEIYIGFLGLVYNVSVNAQNYGPGAEYSAFAGRDATRAFITGNFTHDLNDDIRDIDPEYYSHVDSWASFYSSSYQALGRIEGAFFDSRGCATPELNRIYGIFHKLAQERAQQQEQNKVLPECNSEWNSDLNGGRVWCSTKSGGIERDWVGVPRLLEGANDSSRCVCVNLEAQEPSQLGRFKQYPDCDPKANECALK